MKLQITTAGKGGAIIAIEPKKIKEFTSHLRTYGVSSVKEAQVRELTEQGYNDECNSNV